MRTWLRDHGLLVANLVLFAVFIGGMAVTGVRVYNDEQAEHGGETVSFLGYLATGDFVEATFENWESEFLQMGMYVVLTIFLFQRGSSESKAIDEPAPQDEDPREHINDPKAPWPVRRGGWVLRAYENSLAVLFFLLFLGSWLLHAAGRPGVQRGAGAARRRAGDHLAVHRHLAVLVRVVPELAERVPGRGGHRGCFGLPAPEGLTRVEAGGRAARGHRGLIVAP